MSNSPSRTRLATDEDLAAGMTPREMLPAAFEAIDRFRELAGGEGLDEALGQVPEDPFGPDDMAAIATLIFEHGLSEALAMQRENHEQAERLSDPDRADRVRSATTNTTSGLLQGLFRMTAELHTVAFVRALADDDSEAARRITSYLDRLEATAASMQIKSGPAGDGPNPTHGTTDTRQ